MKKVIGYIRVSTDEQGKSGLGLESQREKIKAYCSLYELELVNVITDIASGKNLKREGLTSALDLLSKGKVEGLIIAKLDRLTRSVKDMGFLLETYFDRHSLYVVAEQIDTGTAAGRLVVNVLMSVAQWERETIGERTKDALKIKKSKNEKTGGDVPNGYTVTINGKLFENENEQKAIRLMSDLKQKGYSFRAIARELEKEGYRTRRGNAIWHPQGIKQILAYKRAA